MQVDMEADKYEHDMRAAPNRVKLLKQRDFLLEQQNTMKKIEAEVTAMVDRLEAVSDEAERLTANLRTLVNQINETPPEGLEAIREQIASLQKLETALNRYEQELVRMRKDGDARDRQQKEIRLRAARTKADFDKLKQEYDEEFKRDSKTLNELKEKAAKEAKPIDEATLAIYNKVKQHVTPPMALLNGDRCGGCNMSLPAATVKQVNASEKIIECDNCGRILTVLSAR